MNNLIALLAASATLATGSVLQSPSIVEEDNNQHVSTIEAPNYKPAEEQRLYIVEMTAQRVGEFTYKLSSGDKYFLMSDLIHGALYKVKYNSRGLMSLDLIIYPEDLIDSTSLDSPIVTPEEIYTPITEYNSL